MASKMKATGSWGLVDIYWPVSPSGGIPFPIPVDANGNIFVTGNINLPNPGDEVLVVRAKVNQGPVRESVGSSPAYFISDVGPCDTSPGGQPNTVYVQVTYKQNGGGEATSDWRGREFEAVTMAASNSGPATKPTKGKAKATSAKKR